MNMYLPVVGIGTGCPGIFQSKKKDYGSIDINVFPTGGSFYCTCGMNGVATPCTIEDLAKHRKRIVGQKRAHHLAMAGRIRAR